MYRPFLFLLFPAVLLFSSCKKERTCECLDGDGTEVDLIIEKESKKKFAEKCEAKETEYKALYPDTECEVK